MELVGVFMLLLALVCVGVELYDRYRLRRILRLLESGKWKLRE